MKDLSYDDPAIPCRICERWILFEPRFMEAHLASHRSRWSRFKRWLQRGFQRLGWVV